LEELAVGDPQHRLPQGLSLEGMHHQGPQDRFRGEVPLPPLVPPWGELLQVLVDQIEDLWVIVQNPADSLVLLPPGKYALGQTILVPRERQHGFRFATHPCPPWALPDTGYPKDRDASFLFNPARPAPDPKSLPQQKLITVEGKEVEEGWRKQGCW